MSIMPQRQYGIYVTIAIALVGGIVAGAILFTSSKASEVDLTSADLVPEDAGVYFAVNTDLTSDQWVAAFDLIQRMGEEDPEQDLRDSAEESDLDWEEEVAPFLGGNASIYLKGFDFASLAVTGAVILKADDAEKALDVILAETGEYEESTYAGVDIFVDEFSGFFATRIGDHIVLAIDKDSLEEVIDVHNGDIEPLSDVDGFIELRNELTRNFLGFVYVNSDALAGDLALDDPEVRDALDEAGLGDLVFQPVAGVIGAKGDAFEFQAAATGDPGTISPMSEPRESRFATIVPAETAIFVSTAGVAEVWTAIREAAGDEIDDAIREDGTYRDLDEALEAAGREIGLESLEELIALFTGETALAGWYTSDAEEDDVFVLLAEVNDEAAARDVIERIVGNETDDPEEEQIAGATVLIFEDDDGEPVAITVHDGYIALGDIEGVRAVLERPGPVLTERDIYREAVAQMPSSLGSYLYIDMARVLRLAEGGIPAQLDEAERVMEGLIINLVNENDIVRVSGALTIAED